MVDTDDTCASTHTLRCTLARGHDGPHTAFRTRVSWTGDVDATARLREQTQHGWQPMAMAPRTGPFLVCWARDADGPPQVEMVGGLQEYEECRSYGEPEAYGWHPLPDPLLSPLRSTPQEHIAWRPIESAPKDGLLVLLHPSRCWSEDAEPFDCEVGYWDEYTEAWESQPDSKADDYTGPTHWMPLPSPLRSTPQEGTTDELTRSAEPGVYPTAVHAANNEKD